MAITVNPELTEVIISPVTTVAQLGLERVDNTNDLEKPISQATQEAINEIVVGAGTDGDITYRQETEPLAGLINGDTWYHTTAHQYHVRRDGVWEQIVLNNELNADFGAVTMNGGNF